MFAEIDRRPPSRAMLRDWASYRSTYQAQLARHGDLVAEVVREARRDGSSTLRRDESARDRFDLAAAVVDELVRANVRFSLDGMNVLHALLGDKDLGTVRGRGQGVRAGKNPGRQYLPGGEVASALSNVVREIALREADGAPTPAIAAMAYQRLISIHPYSDANGRTIRLAADWLLMRDGYPPVLAPRQQIPAVALFWQQGRFERDAHLERMTDGMRLTTELIESAVGRV
jgi:Fic family protein